MEKMPNFINKDGFRKPMELFCNYKKHTSLEGGFKTAFFFQILGHK